MSFTTILAIGLLTFAIYKWGGKFRIPYWVWQVVGIFLLICIVYNADDAMRFIKQEADYWWPVIYEAGSSVSEGLRDLIREAEKGGE